MIIKYVIVLLFGVLIGNFTTTVFYRLPRNIMICGFDQESTKPPFCSNCGHLLQFYEYLPILSWFSTLGKCNYCHIPITKSYFALEILTGLTALALYLVLGENLEYFFIYFCFATLAILNIAIYLEYGFISIGLTLSIIILGMIFRSVVDHQIFPWLASLSIASIISLWIIKGCLSSKNSFNENEFRKISLVHLILPASLWCNDSTMLIFAIILAVCYSSAKIVPMKLFYPTGLIGLFLISLYAQVL